MARENHYDLISVLDLGSISQNIVVQALSPTLMVALRRSGETLHIHFLQRNGIVLSQVGATTISGVSSVNSHPILLWDGTNGVIGYRTSGGTGFRRFTFGQSPGSETTSVAIGPLMLVATNSSYGLHTHYVSGSNHGLRGVTRQGEGFSFIGTGDTYLPTNAESYVHVRNPIIFGINDVAWIERYVNNPLTSFPDQIIAMRHARYSGALWQISGSLGVDIQSVATGGSLFGEAMGVTLLQPNFMLLSSYSTPDGANPADHRVIRWRRVKFTFEDSIESVEGDHSVSDSGPSGIKGSTNSKLRIVGFFGTKYTATLVRQVTPSITGFLQLIEVHATPSENIGEQVDDRVLITDFEVTEFDTEDLTDRLGLVGLRIGSQAAVGLLRRTPFGELPGEIPALLIPRKRYPAWIGQEKLEQMWH